MKKLFQNYKYEFTKNEKKLLSSFCKQSMKQMEGNNQYFAESKAFNQILTKINSKDEKIKLEKLIKLGKRKDEYEDLRKDFKNINYQLNGMKEKLNHLNDEIKHI